MKTNLNDVRCKIELMCNKIGAPPSLIPLFEYTSEGEFVEVDRSGVVHYRIMERGVKRSTVSSSDEDVLYHVMKDVTSEVARLTEREKYDPKIDLRRFLFARQVKLLSSLSLEWGRKRKEEIDQILSRAPYDDYAQLRATLSRHFRESGLSNAEAWDRARLRYPLPK